VAAATHVVLNQILKELVAGSDYTPSINHFLHVRRICWRVRVSGNVSMRVRERSLGFRVWVRARVSVRVIVRVRVRTRARAKTRVWVGSGQGLERRSDRAEKK
jgi:hypothetical protein